LIVSGMSGRERAQPPAWKWPRVSGLITQTIDADVLARGFPAEVSVLRERIRRADGILIVTPEYNLSVPGFLKNALD
jgi:chromate reductase